MQCISQQQKQKKTESTGRRKQKQNKRRNGKTHIIYNIQCMLYIITLTIATCHLLSVQGTPVAVVVTLSRMVCRIARRFSDEQITSPCTPSVKITL